MDSIRELFGVKSPHGLQSVRTTFKLSTSAISKINTHTEAIGITVKELLDNICRGDELFEIINENLQKNNVVAGDKTTRKTYVVSQRTINKLNDLAVKTKQPRDAILEYLIILFDKITNDPRYKRRVNLEEALSILSGLDATADMTMETINEQANLGYDDPVMLRLAKIYKALDKLESDIQREIDENILVNPDEL
ncbi:MAG TPA: hypothetical protein PKN24_16465 [bacterium]|nr:hypothetical protein [bacterium]